MSFKWLLYNLYAYDSVKVRKLILRTLAKLEGGQTYSRSIRKLLYQYHNIEIGMYSYGGCFNSENVPPGTRIGRYCSFAPDFIILNGNHPMSFKSLHPFFYNPIFGYVNELLIQRTSLVIENDVWVGQAAIILPSVTKIENGAVIGAGCVVTENVPPYAILVGNPGRVIKYRFSDANIKEIKNSKWWEKDIHDIKADEDEFRTFIMNIEK